MRLSRIAFLVAVLAVATAASSAQPREWRPVRAMALWSQADRALTFDHRTRMPALVRQLEQYAVKEEAVAARCRYEAARLCMRLGDAERAGRLLELAAAEIHTDPGRRAVLALARLAPTSGRFARAHGLLNRLLRTCTQQTDGHAVTRADVLSALARLHLAAGSHHRALRLATDACALVDDRDTSRFPRGPALRYDLACTQGRALEASGAVDAAAGVYWRRFLVDPATCAVDPRLPLALCRLYALRDRHDQLRARLNRLMRRTGPTGAGASLLEYLDFRAMIRADNLPGLLVELEGVDPAIWRDRAGPEWHFFQAARDLVAMRRNRARDAVLAHAERHGPCALGIYILGLVGDDHALRALYRMALAATSARDLENITTAIGRHRTPVAIRFLERLQHESAAAHPAELRRAARFALQSSPPVGQSLD